MFLPLDGLVSTAMPDAADQELPMAVDDWLVDIFRGDDLNIFSGCRPQILEMQGSPEARLLQFESLVNHHTPP